MPKNIEAGGHNQPPKIDDLFEWRKVLKRHSLLNGVVSRLRTEIDPQLENIAGKLSAEAIIINYENELLRSSGDYLAGQRAAGAMIRRLLEIDGGMREKVGELNQHLAKLRETRAQLASREDLLSASMREVPPATYITRALGEPHPAIEDRWRLVRAKIELGRQLFGVIDPTVTLGPPPAQTWEMDFYTELVGNTKRLQTAQFMLSEDPAAAAAAFGKTSIIDTIGLPPELSPEAVSAQMEAGFPDSWADSAMRLSYKLEPPSKGLIIDQAR